MKNQGLFYFFACLTVIGLNACGSELASTRGKKQEFRSQTQDQAVDFKLLNLRGEEVALKSSKGKVVVLQFFSVACRSCKVETKEFQKHLINKISSSDFEIIGVSVKSTPGELAQWIKDTGATYEMLLDSDGKVFDQLKKTDTFPTLVYLDRNHRIRLKEDYYSGLDQVEKNIQALLDQRYQDVAPVEKKPDAPTQTANTEVFDMFVPDICDGPCARGVEQALRARANVASADIDQSQYRLRVSFRPGATKDEAELLQYISDMGYTPSRFTAQSLASVDQLDLRLDSFPEDQSPESLALDISMEEIPLYQVHFDLSAKKVHITFQKGAYSPAQIQKLFSRYKVELSL